MSDAIYPTLPGLTWPVKRTPMWKTHISTTPSGREWRAALMNTPRYRYTLPYEFLRNEAAFQEFQTLFGFFNARQGSYDSFLFNDASDNTATAQAFGAGDGSTVLFQLLRTLGGNSEPVFALNGAPAIYRNDWQGNQRLYPVARSNLLTWSEQVGDASWIKDNVTITADNNTAPNGLVTADLATETTATGFHRIYKNATVTSGVTDLTLSAWLSATNRAWVYLRLTELTGSTEAYAFFNLSTGVVGTTLAAGNWSNVRASITAAPNGFFRCSVTAQKNNAATVVTCFAGTGSADNVLTFAGSTSANFNPWGLQLEVASQLNAYIATVGATATVTDYTLSSTGEVTFAAAPLAAAALTWTGSYYWRCRFDADDMAFEQFMQQFWKTGEVRLITVKP